MNQRTHEPIRQESMGERIDDWINGQDDKDPWIKWKKWICIYMTLGIRKRTTPTQKWSHLPVMFKQVKTALVKVRISKGAEKTQGTVVKKTRSHLADFRLGKVSHVSRGRWIFVCCSHYPLEMDQKHVILPFFRRLFPSTIAMKSCLQLPHWKFT